MPLPLQFGLALSLFDGFYSFVAIVRFPRHRCLGPLHSTSCHGAVVWLCRTVTSYGGRWSAVAPRVQVEGALLAELACDTPARARIGKINSLVAIGAMHRDAVMLWTGLTTWRAGVMPLVSQAGLSCWNPADLTSFRRFALVISCCSVMGVALSTMLMTQICHGGAATLKAAFTPAASGSISNAGTRRNVASSTLVTGKVLYGETDDGGTEMEPREHGQPRSRQVSLLRFAQDTIRHRNFLRFVCMDSILEAENIFHNQFRQTFVECLLGPGSLMALHGVGWSASQRSWLISTIPSASRLIRIVLYTAVENVGIWPIYFYSFVIKGVAAMAFLLLGAGSSYIPMYLTLSSCCVAAPLGLFGVSISELLDEQRAYKITRGRGGEPSVSGLYQSSHALVAKPINSIGPVVAALVLGPATGLQNTNTTAADIEKAGDISQRVLACFWLITLGPLVCAAIQSMTWRGYTLRGARLVAVQGTLFKLDATSHEP
jgi:hypothetical protein